MMANLYVGNALDGYTKIDAQVQEVHFELDNGSKIVVHAVGSCLALREITSRVLVVRPTACNSIDVGAE